ncbi:MAG: four helix bundle protein [Ignavibacteriales bacterium]|nr:four helix bundle protein [Ignavibacteriales bacterium]
MIKIIYLFCDNFPKSEKFIFIPQLRRAAISISNLAEGYSRKSTADRKRFYEIARSSLVELDTQIALNFT